MSALPPKADIMALDRFGFALAVKDRARAGCAALQYSVYAAEEAGHYGDHTDAFLPTAAVSAKSLTDSDKSSIALLASSLLSDSFAV